MTDVMAPAGLPTITIWQPWATLIALRVKWIETRGWAAPPSWVGRRIGIHAAARKPDHGLRLGPGGDVVTVEYLTMRNPAELLDLCDEIAHPLPLGALVATATLTACVPMVEHVGQAPRSMYLQPLDDEWWLCGPRPDGIGYQTERNVTDQAPFGDFAPGRFAWLLDDIAPTTERCPACDGSGRVSFDPVPPIMGGDKPCPTCDGAGRCDPVPARGGQRVWYWTPDGAA